MLIEPLIVIWGRLFVGAYGIDEYEASLKRSFVGNQNGFITIDNNLCGHMFLYARVAYSLDHGLIEHSRSLCCEHIEIHSFVLTDFGKEVLFSEEVS